MRSYRMLYKPSVNDFELVNYLLYYCHAFEARIYAENVPKGFLPATGVLHHYHIPVSSGVRVDTGVKEGDAVSMHYDPMIAKLVVRGENRSAALVKLKDSLSNFQVAGLPTNVNFLLKLANHWAFEDGNVETHFIDNYKEDLFVDAKNSASAKEAYEAAIRSASLVAACLIEKEHFVSARNPPGGSSLLPIWYASPPFRVHHQAKRTIELEWDNEYDSANSKVLKLIITYQPDGRYLIETEENGSPALEVKATYVKDLDFRVEADGVINDVNLAVYSKEQMRHIHIWQGSFHHYFQEKLGLKLSDDEESQHKPKSDSSSIPRGAIVAPMAGLVVKVLVKNETRVEAGQPVLVLEAMKMEHVVKAPSSGYVHGLQVTVGEQVSDGSIKLYVNTALAGNLVTRPDSGWMIKSEVIVCASTETAYAAYTDEYTTPAN
ncbi:methylcrotonoyl-CoA carboxylase subunit alpha [Trifolium pratense]|uniref:Methylcrotonoyl-CoA carboxylase subunit alpha n=1 Tax=Trifolium pratense TaxID=57577 RepID=A0A2K3NUK5_TRIPR|nr:methylcrotonoyl-CoA carboxylase subunit alpha [Trifolium pratense]